MSESKTDAEIFADVLDCLEALDKRLSETTGVVTRNVEIEVPESTFSALYVIAIRGAFARYDLRYVERPDGPAIILSHEGRQTRWEIRLGEATASARVEIRESR